MKDTLEAGAPALTQAAGDTGGDVASAGSPASAQAGPEQPSALPPAGAQGQDVDEARAEGGAAGSPEAPAMLVSPKAGEAAVASPPPEVLADQAEPAEQRRGRRRPRPGERRLQILQTLAEMLEAPHADRVTTAALAARIQVSEAALYRHFASKAQMFEGLIDFIEHTLFGLINQITASDEDGLLQLQSILTMLLSFSERNPGMTRVLIGDALVTENTRLQARVNQIVDRLEVSLKQCFRTAVAQGRLPDNTDPAGRANLVLSYVLGRWLRFAKGGFKRAPTEGLDAQVMLLIS